MTGCERRTVRAGAKLALALAAIALLAVQPAGVSAEGLPTVTFVSEGGLVTGSYMLNVSVEGDLDPAEVYYGVDEADPSTPMCATGGGHYEALIETASLTDGDHTVYVKALNGTGEAAVESLLVSVDNTAPAVVITTVPPEYVMGVLEVTATVEDEHLNESSVRLVLDGNESDLRWMESSGGEFIVELNTSLAFMCGPHTLQAVATDYAGLEGRSDVLEIDVDNCPPMVNLTSHGGHVSGFYDLTVTVTDRYMDHGEVWAVLDGDRINRTRMTDEGDGNYMLPLDTTTMTDGDHEYLVLATDLALLTREAGPFVLMVDNNPPLVTLTSGGGNVSGYLTVSALAEDPYLNASEVYVVFDGDDANGTQMNWVGDHYERVMDSSALEDGNHTLRVKAYDEWGQMGTTDPVTIMVDNHAPTIRILSGGGTRWGDYVVRANVTDPNLNTSCVKAMVGDMMPVMMSFNGEEWRYTVNTRTLDRGEVIITVMACDYRGNMNDGAQVKITVENRADLRIVEVKWDHTEIDSGQGIKARVTVSNEGHTGVSGFDVAIISARGEVLANTTAVDALAAGKEQTYAVEWEPDGPGDYVVTIEVDSAGVVDEIDEGDNSWAQETLIVNEESPGMGAALAALSLTLLAVGSARRRRSSLRGQLDARIQSQGQ